MTDTTTGGFVLELDGNAYHDRTTGNLDLRFDVDKWLTEISEYVWDDPVPLRSEWTDQVEVYSVRWDGEAVYVLTCDADDLTSETWRLAPTSPPPAVMAYADRRPRNNDSGQR